MIISGIQDENIKVSLGLMFFFIYIYITHNAAQQHVYSGERMIAFA